MQKAHVAFTGLQDRITEHLLLNDPTCHKVEDQWDRDEGEELPGICPKRHSRKGQVFSDVVGKELPPSATQSHQDLSGLPFRAMGVSVVFHLISLCSNCRTNIRYFEAGPENNPDAWWFGSFDLTPYYPFHEDVIVA